MSVDQYYNPKPTGPALCPNCNIEFGKDIFVVLDEDGHPEMAFPFEFQCHEHINDAIANDIDDAGKWTVRQFRQVHHTSSDSHE